MSRPARLLGQSALVVRAFLRRSRSRSASALLVAVCSSGAGLFIASAVARCSSVDETGRFAIAAGTVALATQVIRSAVADGLIAAAPDGAGLRRTGRASALGLGCAALIGVVAVVLRSEYLAVAAAGVHGLAVREVVRAVLVSRGSAWTAVSAEGAWLLSATIAFAGTVSGTWDAFAAFAIWVASGAVIGYVAAATQRFRLVPSWSSTPVPTGRSLAFAGDTLIGSGVVQLVTWSATVIGGLSVAAALRGAGTLAGPVTVCLAAARSLLIPRTASRLGPPRGTSALFRDTVGLCAVAAPGLAFLAFFPDRAGSELLGPTWEPVRTILPLTAIELLFQVVAVVPESAHRALGAGRRIVVIRAVLSVVRVAVMTAVVPFGLHAIALAAAAVTAANAVAWWCHLILLHRPPTIHSTATAHAPTPSGRP